MANSIRDRDKGYKRAIQGVRSVVDAVVTVGIHEEEGRKKYDTGATVAEVAVWNHFGVPASDLVDPRDQEGQDIPARPWMKNTYDSNKSAYLKQFKGILLRGIAGQNVRRLLDRVGDSVAVDMVDALVAFDDPPNAPSTVARKGDDDPLIDTGRLASSHDYRVTTGSTAKGKLSKMRVGRR